MIVCPKCGASGTDIKTLRRDPVNPAEDKFQCLKCDLKFRRYDPTIGQESKPSPDS